MPVGEPARLWSIDRTWSLGFSMVETYTIEGGAGRAPFEVLRTGYWYDILDLAGREIIASHWHPSGISPVTTPHLHLTSRLGRLDLPGGGSVALGEMHIPTGYLDLSDLVGLLITEFDVEPRRPDWESVLRDA
jgi:hypothetical protein